VNIALFGGTFDPIHAGHMQAARAAVRKFRLDQVLFIPTGNPPHKVRDGLTAFPQRFAMVSLACGENPRFVPSLLEAPMPDGRPRFSVDTVRMAKRQLAPHSHLFFLLGMDAFLDLPHWKDYRRLLELVDFIVVSRPGFDPGEIRKVVPQELFVAERERPRPVPGTRSGPSDRSGTSRGGPERVCLRHSTVWVLGGVEVSVASRDIRQAVRANRSVTGLVPPLVEQYILKGGLYRPRRGGKHPER
jgi:nicotinate-nucleotide adenylyltransferase